MNNKTLRISFIIFLLFMAPVYAKQEQQQPPAPLTADDIVSKWKEALGLTDKQVPQVKAIIEERLAQEEQLNSQERKELRKILTGDQMHAWDDLQKQAPQKGKKKHAKHDNTP